MKKHSNAVVMLLIGISLSLSVNGQKITAEEVIAKHLESIGSSDVRSATKTLIAVGPAKQKFTSTADAPIDGRIVIASEATKLFMGMNMASPQYPGQKFVFDGKSANVGITSVGGRDFLGNFVKDNAPLLKSGLLGGTLSTGWLLSNVSSMKGKLTFEDTKRIDGRDNYVLQFAPKGGSDLNIYLYFDVETFRHVRTEYKRMTSAPQGIMVRPTVGASGDNSGKQSETRISLTEQFSDFRPEKGVTLPHLYKIQYSYSGNQGTVQCEWTFTLTEFGVNQKFDPATFSTAEQK